MIEHAARHVLRGGNCLSWEAFDSKRKRRKKSQERQEGTSRDWTKSQAKSRTSESRERRRGPLSATTVENFHGNDSRRVLTSVLKRDSTSIPRMRVSSLSRPVTWRRTPRSLIADRPWWWVGDVQSCRRWSQYMHSDCGSTSRIFSPRHRVIRRIRRERRTAYENRWFVSRANRGGPSHSRRGHLDHPRLPFLFPFSPFPFAIVFMLRTSAFSRAHEGEEYTSVRELFAKRTEEPGRRFDGDVVPPRVRFPDGHAPRSALSEGGCRRHRHRCCCCCCCWRRCIHHRKVIATGGVAEDHFPSRSLPLLLLRVELCFSSTSSSTSIQLSPY